MTVENTFMSLSDVKRLTSLSKTTIYRLMDTGAFPKSIKITTRRVAWRHTDVITWLENK